MYSFTLPLTSALDGSVWSTPHPGRFTPGKDPVPIVRRLDGPQGHYGWVRKISPPTGFDLRTVQPRSESLYGLSYPAHEWGGVNGA